MKSMPIYQSIILSTPITRELHGSAQAKYGRCNNPKCERNGGSEKHKLTIEELSRFVNHRYVEITKDNPRNLF